MFYCVQHKWSSGTSHCPTCNPVKDEDELWDDLKLKMSYLINYSTDRNGDMLSTNIFNELRKHYTLIKK